MRKQELVQLHALCVALRVHLEDRHDAPSAAFRSYDEFGVSPSAVYRRKEAHEEALFHALDGLASATDELPSATDEPPTASDAPPSA